MEKSPEGLGFSNLHQCGKLVAAALDSGSSLQAEDRSLIINHREDTPKERESLDVTLEIEGGRGEALQLPHFVNVSILGADPSTYFVTHAGEDRNFKSSRGAVENQFRYFLNDVFLITSFFLRRCSRN